MQSVIQDTRINDITPSIKDILQTVYKKCKFTFHIVVHEVVIIENVY